jgi:NADH-quinone oxidoreductase subunit E
MLEQGCLGDSMTGLSGQVQTETDTQIKEVDIDFHLLDPILDEFRGRKGAVIPILQRTQDALGYLPRAALRYISGKTLIPLQQLYGVATFYTQFHLKRRGRHIVRVCDGTACHVRGSAKSIDMVEKSLNLAPGSTTTDYKMTLEIVYCLGSCGLAPVALVDEKVYGRLSADELVSRLKGLQ